MHYCIADFRSKSNMCSESIQFAQLDFNVFISSAWLRLFSGYFSVATNVREGLLIVYLLFPIDSRSMAEPVNELFANRRVRRGAAATAIPCAAAHQGGTHGTADPRVRLGVRGGGAYPPDSTAVAASFVGPFAAPTTPRRNIRPSSEAGSDTNKTHCTLL